AAAHSRNGTLQGGLSGKREPAQHSAHYHRLGFRAAAQTSRPPRFCNKETLAKAASFRHTAARLADILKIARVLWGECACIIRCEGHSWRAGGSRRGIAGRRRFALLIKHSG